MKINIYYGGRGVLDDPTLYVLDKMAAVLTELNCETARYNIYENKYRMAREAYHKFMTYCEHQDVITEDERGWVEAYRKTAESRIRTIEDKWPGDL